MNDAVEILLVEDNPHDVTLALKAFAVHRLANRIQVARDGEEALDFMFGRGPFAGRAPDPLPKIVLLDLKLPKVDGLEVLAQLKSDSRTRAIPVVILTSSREERDLIDGYRLGTNSYLVKPVDFDQFVEVTRVIGAYWLQLNQAPPAGARLQKPEA